MKEESNNNLWFSVGNQVLIIRCKVTTIQWRDVGRDNDASYEL